MTPSEKYKEIIQQSDFVADAEQQKAVLLLDGLYQRLLARPENRGKSWWQTFKGLKKQNKIEKGIYFWGGVGRGKTFLMDVFFQSLPLKNKKRVHFHDFMNQTHDALKRYAKLEYPLKKVARELATEIDILCLDEFVIIDIGDAMIMTGLLETLFESGVVLLTTSNAAPKNLYREGLQRARFLPAIELIEQYCDVINIDGAEDYRLRGLQQTHLYNVPHSSAAELALQQYLDENAICAQTRNATLLINSRDIHYEVLAEDIAWFSFEALCKTARSQNDYLELARIFNTLILTDIDVMSNLQDDIARRFVLLIDVIYDHRVKLICTAAATAENLYTGKRLRFEFERTASRLIEMQSVQYLSEAHRQQ